MSWAQLGEILQDWIEGVGPETRGGNMDPRVKWKVKMARHYEYELEILARDEDAAREKALTIAPKADMVAVGADAVDEILSCEEEVP